MRYDTKVWFQRITPGAYDKETGNYGADTVKEELRYASVADTEDEMLMLVYGSIRQGSVTIQLQNQYLTPFDRIRIGEKVYKPDHRQNLRVKQIWVASEVL